VDQVFDRDSTPESKELIRLVRELERSCEWAKSRSMR
jgi:hypothetical protein